MFEDLVLKYYENSKTILRIAFDRTGEPSFCEVYSPITGQFERQNHLMDDFLNDHQTHEINEKVAEQTLSMKNQSL